MRTAAGPMGVLLLGLVAVAVACGNGDDRSAGGTTTHTGSTTTSGSGTGGDTAGAGGTTGSGGTADGGSGGGSAGAGGGEPLDGYGDLSGMCGDIDLEDVESPSPELLENLLDFTGSPAFDPALLSPGGQQMYADGNLGGSSLYSEIFAYEVLWRCDGAELLKSEAEIVYAIEGKKTDLLVQIDGEKVGVSVVRAESYPEGADYPVSQAYDVLFGKLADILQSSVNVAPEDAWKKQILAVMAQTPAHADAIEQAYAMVDAATKADTIVLVTVTEGDDAFLYYNQP